MSSLLPTVHSFEEYEKLKLNTLLFENAAKEIIKRHALPDKPLSLFTESTNTVFAYGEDKVIKLFPPIHNDSFQTEKLILPHLQNKLSVATPILEYVGEIDNWPYLVISRIDGTSLEGLWEQLDHANKMIIMRELGTLIREVHALPTQGLKAIDCHWPLFIDKQITQCVAQHKTNQLSENLLPQIPNYLTSAKPLLFSNKQPVLLTGEYTPMNLIVKEISSVWHIHGLIDFGDCMLGMSEYDLLGPGAFLIQGDKQLLKEFLIAYGYSPTDLNSQLSQHLTALMLLHRYSNLNIQIRIPNWQTQVSNLQELENLAWGL